MSLTHILNTINQKTEQEIKKINKQAEEESQAILNEAEKQIERIKQDLKHKLQKRTESKIRKIQRQAETRIKNKILLKKKEILDDVFSKAAKKLAEKESILQKLYQKLLRDLPQKNKGELIASENDAPLLKKLIKENCKIETTLKEPGFKFASPAIEIDNRLSRLIEEVRDETEIEAAKLLFD